MMWTLLEGSGTIWLRMVDACIPCGFQVAMVKFRFSPCIATAKRLIQSEVASSWLCSLNTWKLKDEELTHWVVGVPSSRGPIGVRW